MRKILIFCLIGLLVGVGLIAVIEVDPGYVLLAYGNYTIETSLWIAVVVLVLFTVSAYLFVRLWRKFWGGKDSVTNWLDTRNTRRSVLLTNRGHINFIEGNWKKSRQLLIKGTKGNDAPLANYLMAARASNQLSESDKMREYLAAAEDTGADAGIPVELTKAEMKLAEGQYEQALASLVDGRRSVGRHPCVLGLMRHAYEGLEDWQALATLLPELRKHKILTDTALIELEKTVYTALMQHSAHEADVGILHKSWSKVPAAVKNDAEIAALYASSLIALQEHDEAQKFISRILKREWQTELVRLFGLVSATNSAKQLSVAQSWLNDHKDDATLLLCLGRLSARNQQWDEARDYFEQSHQCEPGSENCAELGRLLASLGEDQRSRAYFREGLLLEVKDLPDLPMPEKADAPVAKLANE